GSQLFSLDGGSISFAANRDLVVNVQNNRGANRTPLILGYRHLADAEFWDITAIDGSGYKPTSGFVRVPQEKDFVRAVNEAAVGTVIEVDPSVSIDLKDHAAIPIPAGVTIRGNRRGTLFGPELLALNQYDQAEVGPGIPEGLLQIAGDQVRITGLRLHGPSRNIEGNVPKTGGIVALAGNRAIIDHNDLSDWTVAAINVLGGDNSSQCDSQYDPRLQPQNVRVIRNFIHHNQNDPGDGYGVAASYSGYPSIEGNTFQSNIHSVTADGTARGGYTV